MMWAVAAHVMHNLIRYRSKAYVAATNTWLHEGTGFAPGKCGAALNDVVALGVFEDESKGDAGDYVRDRMTNPHPYTRVVQLAGESLGTEGTSWNRRQDEGGNHSEPMNLSDTPRREPLGTDDRSQRESLGPQYSLLHRERPGSGSGGPPERTDTGVELPLVDNPNLDTTTVRDLLVNMQPSAPVWKRPKSAKAISGALGPLGMRLYFYLQMNPTPVKPAELASQANVHVKNVRKVLRCMKTAGLAENTPDGWVLGPVTPEDVCAVSEPSPVSSPSEPENSPEDSTQGDLELPDGDDDPVAQAEAERWAAELFSTNHTPEQTEVIAELDPVPGTAGVIGWHRRTMDDVYEVGGDIEFVRPAVTGGVVDTSRVVVFTQGGRFKGHSVPVTDEENRTGIRWDYIWQNEISPAATEPAF